MPGKLLHPGPGDYTAAIFGSAFERAFGDPDLDRCEWHDDRRSRMVKKAFPLGLLIPKRGAFFTLVLKLIYPPSPAFKRFRWWSRNAFENQVYRHRDPS